MIEENKSLLRSIKQTLVVERAFGISEAAGVSRECQKKEAKPVAQYQTDKSDALSKLLAEYKNCVLCELSQKRTQIVFGSGNACARLMFVGEAPGFDEDVEGLPFVGAAGQLLTKIIEAMKLKREEVYIANCLKCRPPANRNPLPSEIATCKPILMKQIEIIQPEIICALGKFAAQALLQSEEPIGRLRGRFHEWNGLKVMPTFHPAYLLRNPQDKKIVWEDMQKIMRELGIF